jgi:hypothetical protein
MRCWKVALVPHSRTTGRVWTHVGARKSRPGKHSQRSDAAAKLLIYRAFIEFDLEVPKHYLARPVHEPYPQPTA